MVEYGDALWIWNLDSVYTIVGEIRKLDLGTLRLAAL